MKTAELQDALLDYWVARTEGLEVSTPPVVEVKWRDGTWRAYKPSTFWSDGGPLIEKYNLNTSVAYSGYEEKSGHAAWSNDLDLDYGTTPLQAICRAVVRAAFGDEVGEVAC